MSRFEPNFETIQRPALAKFMCPETGSMIPVSIVAEVFQHAGKLALRPETLHLQASTSFFDAFSRMNLFLRGEGRLPHIEPVPAQTMARYLLAQQAEVVACMTPDLPGEQADFYRVVDYALERVGHTQVFCAEVGRTGVIALATFHQVSQYPLQQDRS